MQLRNHFEYVWTNLSCLKPRYKIRKNLIFTESTQQPTRSGKLERRGWKIWKSNLIKILYYFVVNTFWGENYYFCNITEQHINLITKHCVISFAVKFCWAIYVLMGKLFYDSKDFQLFQQNWFKSIRFNLHRRELLVFHCIRDLLTA